MSNKMAMSLKQDLRLVMNTQLRQAIGLLQFNTLELKQFIAHHLEQNPFLEAEEQLAEIDNEISHYYQTKVKLNTNYRFEDEKNSLENYAIPKSLREHLLEQTWLCQFNIDEQFIAEAIIDAIDENGRLTLNVNDIQQIVSSQRTYPLEMIKKILSIIQTFDPIGIAYETLQQCLLAQLNHLSNRSQTWKLAYTILVKHFDLLSNLQASKKMTLMLKLDNKQVEKALELIRSLDPRPGLRFANQLELTIDPDLYVKKIKGVWQVFLVDNILTSVKINNQYQELIKNQKKHVSYEALSKELQEAQWLMKGLKRRNETLFNVANYIVKKQTDFLEYGPTFMKPMNIVEVAQALSLHESTISRVTTGKFIATSRGLFELKYFFPSYVLTESGETCSAIKVKALIKDIIQTETANHIYSDGDIAGLLKQKGINIARRTVAKYRESLKILPSQQRAQRLTSN